MKYDNCKDCQSRCVHAGKDREFVCINGQSCKVTAPKPKTNADRIRAMSDEELADFITDKEKGWCTDIGREMYYQHNLDWLEQPAEGADNG